MINFEKFTSLVDLSTVQAQNTKNMVQEYAEFASVHNVLSVHVLPNWLPLLTDILKKKNSKTFAGGPVGFPSGGHSTIIKVLEAQNMIQNGAQEVDMLINIGRVLSEDYPYIRQEIKAVIQAINPIPLKVILEVYYLNTTQIKKCCDILIEEGATFVKTSTGWTPTGATIENITLIANHVQKNIKIKASGGVRDIETIRTFLTLGVIRFGMSKDATLNIINSMKKDPELLKEELVLVEV